MKMRRYRYLQAKRGWIRRIPGPIWTARLLGNARAKARWILATLNVQ